MLSGLTFFRKDMYDLQPRWGIQFDAKRANKKARRGAQRNARVVKFEDVCFAARRRAVHVHDVLQAVPNGVI